MLKSTIIDAAIKSIIRGEIEVISNRCPTVKSPKSSCHICVEVCPADAITLGEGMIDEGKCFNCGICVSACPAGVYTSRFESDANIVELALSSRKNSYDGRSITFACGMAHYEMGPVVDIKCLGRLTENILLWLEKAGVTDIQFKSGVCAECSLSRGDAVFKHNRRLARVISESAKVKAIPAERDSDKDSEEGFSDTDTKDNESSSGFTRRDFLRRLKGKGILKVGEMVTGATGVPLKSDMKTNGGNTRRRLLKKILSNVNGGKVIESGGGIYLPFGDASVSDECIGCDVCQILCPTSALYKEKSEDNVKLMFSYDRCINCGLCSEVCLNKAIMIKAMLDPQRLVDSAPKELRNFINKTCRICSTEFSSKSESGEICFFCRKKETKKGG